MNELVRNELHLVELRKEKKVQKCLLRLSQQPSPSGAKTNLNEKKYSIFAISRVTAKYNEFQHFFVLRLLLLIYLRYYIHKFSMIKIY